MENQENQIVESNPAVFALMAANTKDALVTLARAHQWRGDPSRTSKEVLALYVAQRQGNVPQQPPQTVPVPVTPQTPQDGERIITALFVSKCHKCGGAIKEGSTFAYRRDAPKGQRARHLECAPQSVSQTPVAASVQGVPGADRNASVAAAIAAALSDLKLGADTEEIRNMVKGEMATVADMLRAEIAQSVYRVEIKLPSGTIVDVGRQHRQFPQLVKALSAGVHVWMAGPAGSGKTRAAEAAAKALNLPFSFDGALDTEYKVTGFTDAQGRVVSTAFRKAYTEGGLHLFDECDASLAPATLAINAALANGWCAFPDGMFKMHPNFRCVAAANTWGMGATFDYVGRNKLDAAFLDRFQAKMRWEYDETLERDVAENPDWVSYVQTMRVHAKAKGLKVMITPRASIAGARLLAAGMAREEVIDLTLRNGMRPEDWQAISKRA